MSAVTSPEDLKSAIQYGLDAEDWTSRIPEFVYHLDQLSTIGATSDLFVPEVYDSYRNSDVLVDTLSYLYEDPNIDFMELIKELMSIKKIGDSVQHSNYVKSGFVHLVSAMHNEYVNGDNSQFNYLFSRWSDPDSLTEEPKSIADNTFIN